MSATQLSEHPALCYFNKRLTKDEFFAKFSGALKKYVMPAHPQQSESPAAKKAAEQSWQQYLKVCNFFEKNQVEEGPLKWGPLTIQPQDLDKLYFDSRPRQVGYALGPRTRYMVDIKNPTAFQSLFDQDKDKIRSIMNLAVSFCLDSDIDSRLIRYFYPLISLIGSTRYPETMALIQLGVDIDQYSPWPGNTPLLLAISKGWNHQDPEDPESKSSNFYPQKEIIKTLIEKKADINAIHLANGMTALHIACLRGDDPELIKLLLENGANIHAKDYEGRTPLELMSLDYESTQKIINTLTFTSDDPAREKHAFGRSGRPEHQSGTATLPLRQQRLQNQANIRILLEKAERSPSESSISQNRFSKFGVSSPTSLSTAPIEKNENSLRS